MLEVSMERKLTAILSADVKGYSRLIGEDEEVTIRQELKARNAALPDHRKMEFRIGVNLGDVVVEGERLYGDGINIAARLESLAEPGGICISGTVYEHVENKLALSYEYLGEQAVKNIAKPVRVWRVQLEPEAADHAIPRRGEVTSPLPRRRAGITHRVWMVVAGLAILEGRRGRAGVRRAVCVGRQCAESGQAGADQHAVGGW